MLEEYLEIFGVAVPILLIGLSELAKQLGLPKKFAGLFTVILGLGASFGYTYLAEEPAFQAGVIGLAIGLSAVGLYSVTKNTKEGINGE